MSKRNATARADQWKPAWSKDIQISKNEGEPSMTAKPMFLILDQGHQLALMMTLTIGASFSK